MRKSWKTRVGLGVLFALSCAASAVMAQDSFLSRLLEQPYDPAVYADDQADVAGEDYGVEQAAMWLQQPAGQPVAPALDPAARRSTRGSRQANVGLASVPNMFGDCGMTTASITVIGGNGATITDSQFMLPMVGGSRTAKIAENDIAMPVDRIFFNYNHYTDIFRMQTQQSFPTVGPLLFRQEPIDRYTMGFEKTFFNALTSIELRMPFTGSFDANLPGLGVSNGNVGNLAVILKGLLYRGENLGIGAGLGIDTPTGSSTTARLGTTNLRFQNDALHLLPYVGFLYAPGDPQWGWGNGLFMTGFLQFDAATNGNAVQFVDPNNGMRTGLGKFNEQNLLFVDLAMGYWLYRNPDAERWTGFAVVNELHYTTSVQDPDTVAGVAGGAGAVITNTSNRFDIMNYTIAMQALMYDASSLRVGAVFPLGSRQDQRFFDAELQVQFNRRF